MVTRRIVICPIIGAVAAGNAGEYYALSLFIRMGFVAGKAPAGTSAFDLLVLSQDQPKFVQRRMLMRFLEEKVATS